jgi:hypothetical protein
VWRARIILLSADGIGTSAIMSATGKSKTSQLQQLGASFPVFLSGGVRKVNVLAAFGKAFRRSSVVTRKMAL